MVATEKSYSQQHKLNASERVRASRDGDRFHYTWAASKLLRMLNPADNLQQVSVEGLGFQGEDPDGSEIIDLVEYYGSSEDNFDTLIVRQFKYSTLQSNRNLNFSDICHILSKFAILDTELHKLYCNSDIYFSIVTNKTISPQIIEFIENLKKWV